MQAEAETDFEPRHLFTAPWEPVVVRRGDALGLRALADQFADALAPDFSNRVRDGRWVTVLAWSLARSQEVFHASGGRSVATRAQQRERYAWLRPLELMWVARTIALAEDWLDRSLAGRRRTCRDGRESSVRHVQLADMVALGDGRRHRRTVGALSPRWRGYDAHGRGVEFLPDR